MVGVGAGPVVGIGVGTCVDGIGEGISVGDIVGAGVVVVGAGPSAGVGVGETVGVGKGVPLQRHMSPG